MWLPVLLISNFQFRAKSVLKGTAASCADGREDPFPLGDRGTSREKLSGPQDVVSRVYKRGSEG